MLLTMLKTRGDDLLLLLDEVAEVVVEVLRVEEQGCSGMKLVV